MSRKKLANSEELLCRNLIIRVHQGLFEKLERLKRESHSPSVAEVCRQILNDQKIKVYTQDASMNPVMEELAGIRKELKSIGVNINQVVRKLNGARSENQRSYYALQTAGLYKTMELKVDRLLVIVSSLAEKWLQK
jgi:hypothetical protein